MKVLNNNVITIYRAALMLEVSVNTIERWYKWYNDPQYIKRKELILPDLVYTVNNSGHKCRGLYANDFDTLKQFQKNIQRGDMANYNARHCWGKYGKAKTIRPADWKRKNAKED